MIAAIYARNSFETNGVREEFPPEIREFIIDKLAEILVLDYRQAHNLIVPTDGESPQQRGES